MCDEVNGRVIGSARRRADNRNVHRIWRNSLKETIWRRENSVKVDKSSGSSVCRMKAEGKVEA
jgi:hypothetical protein